VRCDISRSVVKASRKGREGRKEGKETISKPAIGSAFGVRRFASVLPRKVLKMAGFFRPNNARRSPSSARLNQFVGNDLHLDPCRLQRGNCFPSASCILHRVAFAYFALEPVDSQPSLMLPAIGTFPAKERVDAALVGVVKN